MRTNEFLSLFCVVHQNRSFNFLLCKMHEESRKFKNVLILHICVPTVPVVLFPVSEMFFRPYQIRLLIIASFALAENHPGERHSSNAK